MVEYAEAVEYILKVPKFTTKNNLKNTEYLLERLGSPCMHRKIIHVAGTNGKGSVCAYMEGILRAAGKSTGLFTSPHLVTVNERFKVQGRAVSNRVFMRAFEKVMESVRQAILEGNPHPTFFELLFLMGMVIFEYSDVEYIILETGLGGRLDATNVVKTPIVTIITAIGIDHTEYLGDTVSKIAAEKAGIIKSGVPVVYLDNCPNVKKVIEQKASECGSIFFPIRKSSIKNLKINYKSIDFCFNSRYYEYISLSMPTKAIYQAENAALVIEGIVAFDSNREISIEAIKRGLGTTIWEGRMEEVIPDVFLDGAHNESGMKAFVETIQASFADKRKVLLFSAVEDKHYREMIQRLLTVSFEMIVVTEVPEKRGASATLLAAAFYQDINEQVVPITNIKEAFYRGLTEKGNNGVLFVVGSLYLVGEIKSILGRKTDD